MEPTDASARLRQFLDNLGPVVIRDSDRRVSPQGMGGGVAIINYGPPEPIPAEFMEKLRELADAPPAASPGHKP